MNGNCYSKIDAMVLSINNVVIPQVEKFYFGGNCEVTISFKKDHSFTDIEEIISLLSQANVSVGNYFFKGVDAYHYDDVKEGTFFCNGEKVEFNDCESTEVLCTASNIDIMVAE